MPIYEEKLISPLAVRFTQEHIKTIFRDGHVVEETAAQIEAGPGSGDYDITLRVPFPTIEIIRWSAPGAKESDKHWFTLDNRRLYCLQRAAAQYWPKRVGAIVEILYADPGSVHRKYDSTTFGRSVTVSPSCKEAMLFRWDWRSEVANAKFVRPTAASGDDGPAKAAVVVDDAKDSVGALADAPGGAGAGVDCVIARACEALCADEARSRSSTATPSEDGEDAEERGSSTVASDEADGGSGGGSLGTAAHAVARPPAKRKAVDASELSRRAVAEIVAQLKRDGDGHVRVPRWAERYGAPLGGMGMRLFLSKHPDIFKVVPDKSGKWIVKLVGEDLARSTAATSSDEQASSDAATHVVARPAPKGVSREVLAERGIAEIVAQLDPLGLPSYVHIPDWNRRYVHHLGQLRTFAESRPDVFVVVPSGRGFLIASASGARAAQRASAVVQYAMQKLQLESLAANAGYMSMAHATAY